MNKRGLRNHRIAVRMLNYYASGAESCKWPGTTWTGEGRRAKLKPCGIESVGAGLFCDPTHTHCAAIPVCERHKQPIRQWADSNFNEVWV